MTFGVYCVRDLKSGWLSPTVDNNDQTAIRNFEHAVMQKNTLFYSHARDYDLFKIGQYDSTSGELIPEDPTLLIEGAFVRGTVDV